MNVNNNNNNNKTLINNDLKLINNCHNEYFEVRNSNKSRKLTKFPFLKHGLVDYKHDNPNENINLDKVILVSSLPDIKLIAPSINYDNGTECDWIIPHMLTQRAYCDDFNNLHAKAQVVEQISSSLQVKELANLVYDYLACYFLTAKEFMIFLDNTYSQNCKEESRYGYIPRVINEFGEIYGLEIKDGMLYYDLQSVNPSLLINYYSKL